MKDQDQMIKTRVFKEIFEKDNVQYEVLFFSVVMFGIPTHKFQQAFQERRLYKKDKSGRAWCYFVLREIDVYMQKKEIMAKKQIMIL